jgi:hypothetical protein
MKTWRALDREQAVIATLMRKKRNTTKRLSSGAGLSRARTVLTLRGSSSSIDEEVVGPVTRKTKQLRIWVCTDNS